jgi:putative NADH-flavin reductase
MKVALIGATGNAGSRLLAELVARGHAVTAIARHPEKVTAQPGVTAKRGDVFDKAGLTSLLGGHDAAISAVRFAGSDPRTLIDAIKAAGVKRYLVVGGAGSLEVAPGRKLVDTPTFPEAYKPESLKGVAFLQTLREEKALDWTFVSPSALFVPGQRTGKFRLGTTDCSAMTRATAPSLMRTLPLRSSMNWKNRRIPGGASRSATESIYKSLRCRRCLPRPG